ncbi:MAG: rhodanese-like domain-containing protein, partial [Sulfurimonas sp.]|nr:rhodanese-like domain-containing protein [Sulfurimonas sp.]
TKAGGKLCVKTTTKPEGNFNAKVNDAMLIDMQNVKKSIGKIKMVDSRPAKYYFGSQKQGSLKHAGHIAQAKSYSWQYSLNKDNTLKSKKVLSETIEKGMQLNKNDDLIIYCTGGLEAAMNYFVFHKVLGFNKAALYDSSMLEWANRDDTPMTKYRWE